MDEIQRFFKMLPIKLVVATIAVIVILGACSDKARESFHDGPRSKVVNSEPSDILEFPDGFSNMATKCDHGNRVYSAFRSDDNRAAIAISPQDPSCPQIGTALTIERDGTTTEE